MPTPTREKTTTTSAGIEKNDHNAAHQGTCMALTAVLAYLAPRDVAVMGCCNKELSFRAAQDFWRELERGRTAAFVESVIAFVKKQSANIGGDKGGWLHIMAVSDRIDILVYPTKGSYAVCRNKGVAERHATSSDLDRWLHANKNAFAGGVLWCFRNKQDARAKTGRLHIKR